MNSQRVLLIFVIQLAVIELFERVKIFDFFSYFVRQLREIIYDSAPLAAMLAFIVIAQALLFFILDQNSEEKAYEGWTGFMNCAIHSYLLAIGDFEGILNSFLDTSDYVWLFWIIFFIGTLLSLLIILNMVIAVMSSTFERVESDTEAYILRERISLIYDYFELLPKKLKQSLKENPYLITIQVDPDVDPIPDDTEENRLSERIDRMEKNITALLLKNGMGGDNQN